MAYDRAIRAAIEPRSRKRIPDEPLSNMVKIPTEENGAAKKSILRELVASQAEKKTLRPKTTIKGDPSRRKGKVKRQKSKCNTSNRMGPNMAKVTRKVKERNGSARKTGIRTIGTKGQTGITGRPKTMNRADKETKNKGVTSQ